MPEMRFGLRWPDGSETLCYSPSLVIEEHLTPGTRYELADFVHRSREALQIGSERIRRIYGFPCSRAVAEIAAIERRAAEFAATPDAAVTVTGFHREPAGADA